MAFTVPLFAIDDRPYALLDVLGLPVALGVAWVAVGALTHLVQFADSALLFDLEVWTRMPHHQYQLVSDLNYRIEAAFRRHGVEMPFPQHDVRLRSPDLSAIALAFARRHLGDDALADARGMLATGAPADDTSDLSTDAARPTWSDQDLDAIVARLHGPSGVDIGDRRHLLTVYRRCFIGRDAVDWLARNEGLTRADGCDSGRPCSSTARSTTCSTSIHSGTRTSSTASGRTRFGPTMRLGSRLLEVLT
ncbi:MAG TPA: hypothetical protein VJ829_02475 [Candidatus Binatia bacterium]|nr:hypothetical protein [Candidatus Binatia bacterium]